MRDYLHIWHDVARRSIVASGIEFKDFLPFLTTQGGIVLIDHRSEVAVRDTASGLDYVPVSDLGRGNGAFWLRGGSTLAEERTRDIDAVLNRRLQRPILDSTPQG